MFFSLNASLLKASKPVAPSKAHSTNYKKLETFSKNFSELLVLDQGRYKPLDSYARTKLLQFSGKTSIKIDKVQLSYLEWFTALLFEPDLIYPAKLFLINNPEVLTAINVTPDAHRRYSYDELRSGISVLNKLANQAEAKSEAERSLIDKEFIRVSNNFHEFTQIASSFSLFQHKAMLRDLSGQNLRQALEINSEPSLFDLIGKAPELEGLIKSQTTLKADAVKLGFVLYSWVESYREYLNSFRREEAFAILPNLKALAASDTPVLEFLNPWTYFYELGSGMNEDKLDSLKHCQNLQRAYDKDNPEAFKKLIIVLNKASYAHIKSLNKSVPKLNLELLYNRIDPLAKAQTLYLFALLVLSAAMFLKGRFLKPPLAEQLSFGLFSAGFTLHAAAILLRILILERAPVSNLYETFVFVGLITALLGLVLRFVSREKEMSIFLASLSAFLLLLISSKFVTDGDSMKVLMAVLDSNFWLSTHVIAEMIGYAGVSLAGLIGHVYLIKYIVHVRKQGTDMQLALSEEFKFLNKIILGMVGFGLCFTFLGTMLGGVWADQSWGRFWGWDPKENGALLILLWTAITLHARLAGYIKDFGVAIFAVIGTMVVMLSWFGVNLLGVGLHSYGFTQGLMTNLLFYLSIEIIFIISVIALRK